MLIVGTVELQHLNETNTKGRPLRSYLMTKKANGTYYVSLKNSMFPNSIEYRVADIETMHNKFTADGKLGLRFKNPMHLVLIQADDKKSLQMFARQIHDIIDGKNVAIVARHMPKTVPSKRAVTNHFSPFNTEYEVVSNYFDTRVLNMINLSKLVLDNCTLSSLPEQIGNLPINHFSLNNVIVPNTGSPGDRDMFWNWMCMDTICSTLKTLKMDNIGLNMLPFELMYLNQLQTLSLANNNLKYLPQHIGKLKKLKNFNVSGNKLSYFPIVLVHRNFHQLDISNNNFLTVNNFVRECDHMYMYVESCDRERSLPEENVQSLRNLSFYSLFSNNVKYRRQDIPRTLWHLYDVIFNCGQCKRLLLPSKVFLVHILSTPMATVSLIKSHNNDRILYQKIVCHCKVPYTKHG